MTWGTRNKEMRGLSLNQQPWRILGGGCGSGDCRNSNWITLLSFQGPRSGPKSLAVGNQPGVLFHTFFFACFPLVLGYGSSVARSRSESINTHNLNIFVGELRVWGVAYLGLRRVDMYRVVELWCAFAYGLWNCGAVWTQEWRWKDDFRSVSAPYFLFLNFVAAYTHVVSFIFIVLFIYSVYLYSMFLDSRLDGMCFAAWKHDIHTALQWEFLDFLDAFLDYVRLY